MEEKDRQIHFLELKVQQLMRDTLTISEEQSRFIKFWKQLLLFSIISKRFIKLV